MTTINVQQTLNQVLGLLDEFTADSGFLSKITTAFGEEKAANITPSGLLSALNTLPAIDIRSSEELNGALGAFSAQTGKIYLSEGILNDQNLVIRVLLEEIGHYLDNYFGGGDAAGDEGEIFRNLVLNQGMTEVQLNTLKNEDDHATIILDGQEVAIEMAFGTNGYRQFGTSSDDTATGIKTDSSGNVYVTGNTGGSLPGNSNLGYGDAFVAKYDVSGNQLWVKQFGTSNYDDAQGISTDSSGNVYVTGYTEGSLPGYSNLGLRDAFVAKYDVSGNQLWVKQFGTLFIDFAYGISTDSSGNVYVTGNTTGSLPGNSNLGNANDGDAFVAKYNASGTQLWVKQFGTSSDDEAKGISTDSSGNIYVTGSTLGSLPGYSNLGSRDAFVAKYDASGNQLWVKQFGTSGSDYAYGISTESSGNVYVTGYTSGSLPGNSNLGGGDAFIVGFDSNGNLLNDDDTPTITLAISPNSVTEDGTTNLVYTFTRTGILTNALTVNYTIGGTAANGTDYATIGTNVNFAANSPTATVTINPTVDTIFEPDETVALTLATGTGYTVGSTTTAITGTITNDETNNDNFANRTVLTGKNITTTGTNIGFTGETGEPSESGTINSAWWSWTATTSAAVVFDTIGSNFDTYLFVFTGNTVNALTLVTSDDDSGGSQTSKVSFTPTAGTTYQIAVDGYNSSTGNISLNVNQAFLPALSTPDFNKDGNTDLLWRNSTTGQVAYWYMNNSTLLGGAIAGSAPLEWKVAGTGDFNKDGKDDLLWQNTATGQVGYWYMDNSSVLGTAIAGFAPLEWKVAGTGDFNKDGKDDLLWRNTTTGQVAYWYMDNTNILSGAIAGSVSLDWKLVGTGDFNKDTKDDLLWQNTATGQVAYWYMDNTTTIGTAIAGSAPLDWKVAGARDFNKDGKDDLLWQNTATGEVGYWYMDNSSVLGTAIAGSASGWNLI